MECNDHLQDIHNCRTSDEKSLKPCDRCGGDKLRVIGPDPFPSVVSCECGHGGSYNVWNNRPIEDELQKQLTAARERIEALEYYTKFYTNYLDAYINKPELIAEGEDLNTLLKALKKIHPH